MGRWFESSAAHHPKHQAMDGLASLLKIGPFLLYVRPYRLAWSRTSPFHGENMGSNPIGDAKLFFSFHKGFNSKAFIHNF